MKKLLFALLILLTGLSAPARPLPGAWSAAGTSESIERMSDLQGKRVAYLVGSPCEAKAAPLVSGVTYLTFNDNSTCIQALLTSRVDAVLMDEPVARRVMARFPGKVRIVSVYAKIQNGFAFRRGSPMTAKVSEVIRGMRASGELERLAEKWCGDSGPAEKFPEPLPERPGFTGKNGVFRFVAEPTMDPLCYAGPEGEYLGLEFDVARRVAQELDMTFAFSAMDFGAETEALATGRADMAGGGMFITDERREKVDFSEPYYESGLALVTKRPPPPARRRTSETIVSMEDLRGLRVAYLTGGIFRSKAEPLVSGVEYLTYNDNSSSIQALLAKRVDAVLIDEPVARIASAMFPEKLRIACVYAKNANGFAFRKGSPLTAGASAVIRRLKASGELARLTAKWCDSADPAKKVPEPLSFRKDFTGKAGELHFIADPVMEPMCYSGPGGEFIGLDIDLARRIAYELDMTFRFTPMDFRGEIEALSAGKATMAGGSMFITPERQEKVDFTEPYYDGGLAVLARKDPASAGRMTSETIVTLKDIVGMKAAYLNGSAFKTLTEPMIDGVTYLAFNDNTSSAQALASGKVDVMLIDEPIARNIVAAFGGRLRIACVYAKDSYGFAFRKGSPLAAKATAVLRRLRQSGELRKLSEKWCDAADLSSVRLEELTHRSDFTGSDGEFRFASDPTLTPMCYVGPGGGHLGLEIDLARRIAYELNMTFRFIPMEFRAEIEALRSGKVDMAGGTMSITDERKEKIDFSDPYYIGGLTLLARSPSGPAAAMVITDASQLYGKRIGTVQGTTADAVVRKEFARSEAVPFASLEDLPKALEAGRIEAFLAEEPVARDILRRHPGIDILPKRLPAGDYAMIFPVGDRALCDAFSAELRALKKDGTAARLLETWQTDIPEPAAVPRAEKGTLRYAVVPETAPYAFLHRGTVVGYEISLVTLAAARLGYALEAVPTDWANYFSAVAEGRVRFGVGCTTVTERRKRTLLFSEPTGRSHLVVLVNRAAAADDSRGAAAAVGAFFESLGDSFYRTFVRESRWRLLVRGLTATVLITLFSAVFGTLLAFVVCMMRRSRMRILSGTARVYIAVMQGTPILVVLMILYYLVFAKVNMDAMAVAVIGFSMNFAAYVGEMLRSGIDGIPRGQYEAAHALGFTRFGAFRKVILPQVLRRILPIYRGEFVSMLKMTSVVGYIAIEDLTKMSDIIRSLTYEAFFPLIVTALIYFAAAHLLALAITRTEQYLDPERRRRRLTAKGGPKA